MQVHVQCIPALDMLRNTRSLSRQNRVCRNGYFTCIRYLHVYVHVRSLTSQSRLRRMLAVRRDQLLEQTYTIHVYLLLCK